MSALGDEWTDFEADITLYPDGLLAEDIEIKMTPFAGAVHEINPEYTFRASVWATPEGIRIKPKTQLRRAS